MVRQIVFEGIGGLKELNSSCVAQLKYDGSEYHLHIKNGKAYALTSKRISKKTGLLNEKLSNMPQLKKEKYKNKKETIYVGEIVAEHLKDQFDKGLLKDKQGEPIPWERRSNYVAGIMNSSPENLGKHNLKFVVFDVLYYEGKDVSEMPYGMKYNIIKNNFTLAGLFGDTLVLGKNSIYGVSNFHFTETYRSVDDFAKMFYVDCIAKNFEGCIYKDISNNFSYKKKGEKDSDCIIIGFTEGTGKYKKNNWIGAIEIGVLENKNSVSNLVHNELSVDEVDELLENEEIIPLGKISGFDEGLRSKISKNKDNYIGKVVHVKYTNWTGNAMRHPRIGEKGIRFDKLIKRCTVKQFEKISNNN